MATYLRASIYDVFVGEPDPENLRVELNSPVHKNLIPLIPRDSIVDKGGQDDPMEKQLTEVIIIIT